MSRLNRRELIAGLLGCPAFVLSGCKVKALPPEGELRHTSFAVGHRIRDGLTRSVPLDDQTPTGVVIVGGGVAGLSAAWRLKRAGYEDFILLELEDRAGGTARSGRTGEFAYPWGAHYIPTPMTGNRPLIRLLQEMQVVERLDIDGTPIIGEQYRCRDPHERLHFDGEWHEGVYPLEGASEEDLRQLSAFQNEIDHWVQRRDDSGRRMFAVPLSNGSDCEEIRALDQISMAQWLDQKGWNSPRLQWLVNYGCRDDYGLPIDRVSAWAGLFYFTARVSSPGQEPQGVITWPEGNGRVIDHFVQEIDTQIREKTAVCRITPSDPTDSTFKGPLSIIGIDTEHQSWHGWLADKVIFAAPQMLAPHLIRDSRNEPARNAHGFQYGSWLVANVHLRDRPIETGFPLCWDNVLHGSSSLGYVTSTHQSGIDHGPTVLTWYHPFADLDATVIRRKMLELQWSDWAEFVMEDLRLAHRDIDSLVTRIDIMLWGHAMIQPRVGFTWSDARIGASKPLGSIHFGGTDLSGIALFEEAFDHGVRAAEETLDRLGHEFHSLLPTQSVSRV